MAPPSIDETSKKPKRRGLVRRFFEKASSKPTDIPLGDEQASSSTTELQQANQHEGSQGSSPHGTTVPNTQDLGLQDAPMPNTQDREQPVQPAGRVDTVPQPISSRAPIWDQAIRNFQKDYQSDYESIDGMIQESNASKWNALFDQELSGNSHENQEQKKPKKSHAIVQRLKRALPSLGLVKGFTMTLANLDPHKVAPFICAAVFFTIELSLNQMNPQDREKALDILADSAIIINKWISFETHFGQKNHPAIKDEVENLQQSLLQVYLDALKLVSYTQKMLSSGSKSDKLVDTFTKKIELLAQNFSSLKRQDNKCLSRKEAIKDVLASQQANADILKWISSPSDPEPSHKQVKMDTGTDNKYQECGKWFLESPEFISWAGDLEIDAPNVKPVLWLNGTMGTGKTTLICRAISHLQKLEEDKILKSRIIHYYCYARGVGSDSTRPNQETIIRSLCRKISWQSDFTVAKCSRDLYNEYKNLPQDSPNAKPTIDDWKKLLKDLIADDPRLFFVIDALDECVRDEEASDFLDFFHGIGGLRLLCSSRQHIRVDNYFENQFYEINAVSDKAKDDMTIFIKEQISSRKNSAQTKRSIFFKPELEDLLEKLQKSLLVGSQGMFRWVEIWLGILFPPRETQQVEDPEHAQDFIKELGESKLHQSVDETFNTAYKRLWNSNTDVKNDKLQVRVFKLVLCAFEPLTPYKLVEALKIDPLTGKENAYLEARQVEPLYYNFLVTNSKGTLEFAHETAKHYIKALKVDEKVLFSEAENHLEMAKICLQVMKKPDHTTWKRAAIDPSKCYQTIKHTTKDKMGEMTSEEFKADPIGPLLAPMLERKYFATYIAAHWAIHCTALAQDMGLFEVIWKDCCTVIFDSPTLPGIQLCLFATWYTSLDEKWRSAEFLEETSTGLDFLPSHFFSRLDLVTERQIEAYTKDLSNSKATFPNVDLSKLYMESLRLNTNGSNALHIASQYGSIEAFKFFLELETGLGHVSSKLLFGQNSNGQTALHVAAMMDQPSVIEYILQLKAPFNDSSIAGFVHQEDLHGDSALDLAIGHRASKRTLKLLLKAGEIKAGHIHTRGNTLLHLSAVFNNDIACKLLLEDDLVGINAINDTGSTALHLASLHNALSVVKILATNKNVDLNLKNDLGHTALHSAVAGGGASVVKYLLSTGEFDINQQNKGGQTVLHLVLVQFQNKKDHGGGKNLFVRMRRHLKKMKLLELLLESEDINVDVRDSNGRTPVDLALLIESKFKDSLSIAELLMNCKARRSRQLQFRPAR